MKLLFSLVAATLLVAISSTAVLAEAFIYEPFDYSAGEELIGQNGGTGWLGEWTDIGGGNLSVPANDIVGTSLSYNDGTNDLVTSGGHAVDTGSLALRRFDMEAINTANPGLLFEDKTEYSPGFHIGKAGTTVWASYIYQSPHTANGEGGWGGVALDDGDVNRDGALEAGGKNFQNNFDVVNGGDLIQFDPLPGTEEFRTLTAFDARGDMGGEIDNGGEDASFALRGHRGPSVHHPLDSPDRVEVNASPASFVLMRFDFQVDPSNPFNNPNTPDTPGLDGNYYQDWPVDSTEADTVRMWINPSLTTEPTDADSPLIFEYESQSGFIGSDISGWPHSGEASQDLVLFIDRFDLKFDRIHLNSRLEGAVWDELRYGTTFADVTPIVGGTDPINGDYDNDGFVGQSDLDLVLLNWGDTSPPAPAGWVNQVPTGLIGQGALDGVLLNWGNSASSQLVGVPEPSSALLFLLAVAAGGLSRKR